MCGITAESGEISGERRADGGKEKIFIGARSRPARGDFRDIVVMSRIGRVPLVIMENRPSVKCRPKFSLLQEEFGVHRLSARRVIHDVNSGDKQPAGPDAGADGREEIALQVIKIADQIVGIRFDGKLAALKIGDAMVLASDGRCLGQPNFQGFALSLTVPDAAEAERLFTALADGGQAQMPLTTTFFAARFGMVADRFGVAWMISVAP